MSQLGSTDRERVITPDEGVKGPKIDQLAHAYSQDALTFKKQSEMDTCDSQTKELDLDQTAAAWMPPNISKEDGDEI